MEIIYMSLDDIKPYKNNPRNNDNAVDYVAKSIKEFGFKVPIVIDKDNVIVTGHTRYKAAQKLEIAEVPCIKASDLNEEQIKAFRLADNKVSEYSTWDFDLLVNEITNIQDIEMEEFGFIDMEEIDLDEFFEEKEEAQEEKVEEPKEIQCPHCQMWFTLEKGE